MKPTACLPIRILPLVAALVVLAGCQRSVFEHRGEPLGCDPDIVGRWEMVEKEDDRSAEPERAPDRLLIEINAVCSLRGQLTEKGAPRDLGETAVSTSQHGSKRYIWVNETWANRAFEIPVEPSDEAPGWYAYAYTVRRGTWRLQALDIEALAADVVRDKWKGDVLKQDSSLWVRVEENPEGVDRLLRKARLVRDRVDRIEFLSASPEVERE